MLICYVIDFRCKCTALDLNQGGQNNNKGGQNRPPVILSTLWSYLHELGATPYKRVKQRVKYLGSLKPTL